MDSRFPIETQHPLQASVEAGDVVACYRNEDCRLWGNGVLKLLSQDSNFWSTVMLTWVGCEACSDVETQQQAVGTTLTNRGSFETERAEAVAAESNRAHRQLAGMVASFTPPQPPPEEPPASAS